MKYLLGAGIAAMLLLTACGGGGSAPGPLPSTAPHPTATPTTTTMKIKWVGGDNATPLSIMRDMVAGGNASTILITAPDADVNNLGSNPIGGAAYAGSADTGGQATVEVSPQPSATPDPAWQVSDPGNSFSNTSAVQATTAPQANLTAIAMNSASSSSITANVPNVGATTDTVIRYNRLTLACTSVDPTVYSTPVHGGVAFPSTYVDDPAQADVYLDGPRCFGKFANPNESEITVHCPNGCAFISDAALYLTTGAGAYTNPVTSIGVKEMFNTARGIPGFLVVKAPNGDLYKWSADFQDVTNVTTTGPICKLTACVDGT